MSKATITVITTIYKNDNLGDIRSALSSLLSQTCESFLIFIAVDGPISTSVSNYLDRLSDDRIVIFRLDRNFGVSHARNYAISMVETQYIAIMDSDDISVPERLKSQLMYLEENDLDAISSFLEVFDDENDKRWVRRLPVTTVAIREAAAFFCPLHNTALFAKTSVLKENLYSESLRVSEDYDLFVRLLKRGYKLENVPEALVCYRQPASAMSKRRGFNYAISDVRVKISALPLISILTNKMVFFPMLVSTFFIRLLPEFFFSFVYSLFNQLKNKGRL